MSARRTGIRLGLTLAACALLAACAIEPPKPPPKPATVIARPEPPPTIVAKLPKAAGPDQPWSSLTASFAMRDCNDSPLVRAKLALYTHSPVHLERLLRQSLPLMMYVQKQLQAAGIPGEFVMLPMLESSYDPSEPSRHGDPAGMWQLMPATARLHGIRTSRDYDGRLDPVASTRVAVHMLSTFGEQFGDWRLADLAYNAGPQAVVNAMRRHPELGDGAIPDLPIGATSRKHLAKLMALSCILREPERFHVKLPKPSEADHLAVVEVPTGLRLQEVAEMAEIPEKRLRTLNPGYLGARVPPHSPGKLLLPATAADALAAALTVDASEPVAEVSTSVPDGGQNDDIPLPAEPSPPPVDAGDPPPVHAARHRVREGETLWSIAHHYEVSVGELKRWNHLHGDDIRPGEELRVRG
ncbi:MAG: transglycosylase SLT domain-containing protein [Rhodanobacteraceae bacterium]